MCLKSGFLLAGLILALWPGSLSSPGFFGPPVLLVAGGGDVNYLAIPRVPEWPPDMAGSDLPDLPSVESETETQTGTTNHTGTSDWAGEAARTGDRGLRQPSTRGGLRVWVSHYSAPIGAVVASEHPAGFRPGICATYAVRDESRRIVGAYLPGHGILPFGTVIDVGESDSCALWDTGTGYADGRAWIDIAVASDKATKELGASWREVRVIE